MTEPADDSLPLRELRLLVGGQCQRCRTAYSAREAVASIALGFKNAVRCWACLAEGLGRDADELRTDVRGYVARRDCYAVAWAEAERLEGVEATEVAASKESATATHSVPDADESWDAGTMGCGDLVLALRSRLIALAPGTILKLTARDPGAPADIPAWCRLTGHTLLANEHPDYWIRRRPS